MSLPPHGTEVFVGGMDRSTTEDELRAFCAEAGEVFSVKMMMDPANPSQNRGYSFVTFSDKEAALRAMDRLGGTEMPSHPGHRLRVQPSQAKNKLWVGGLPHHLDENAIREALEPLGLRGLSVIDLAKGKDQSSDGNRGYVFLEFYNATAATQAKSKLAAPEVRIGDRPISVDVAEPSGRDAAAAGGSKTVFVGNLPPGVTEDQLREAFSGHGDIEKVHIPRPRDGGDPRFGFVTYTERVAAARAVDAEQKPELAGVTLVVKYGRAEGQGAGGQQQQRGGGPGGMGGGYPGGMAGGYAGGYPQQYAMGGMGGMAAMGGMGGMMGMGGGGMMPMMAVQLPNGQMGYMPMMGDGMGMGGPMRSRGGGYRGGGGGRGGRGGRGGGTGGGQRYQPY